MMVEATCLAWVLIDLDAGRATRVRIHAAPENVVFPDEPDVVPVDPDAAVSDSEVRRARLLARNAPLPFPFELML